MTEKKYLVSIYQKILKSVSRGHGLGQKYKIIRVFQNKIESYLKTDYVELWAGKMFLLPNDDLGLSISGVYGPFDTKIVKDNVKFGDIVVDLGAHIGYFTLILAKLVGKNGKVFAFEPEPKNFEKLKKNVEINGYTNVVLINKAVSNVNGKCTLYIGEKTSGANRIYEPKKTKTQSFTPITSETIRLDDYFESKNLHDKISFIKMDIEGAEFFALKGMHNILSLNKNLKIFTEISEDSLEDIGTNYKEMLKILHENGFSVHYADNRKNDLMLLNDEMMEKIITKEKSVNVLCTKNNN